MGRRQKVRSMKTLFKLQENGHEINDRALVSLYPISRRFVLKRASLWLLPVPLLAVLYLLFKSQPSFAALNAESGGLIARIVLYSAAGVAILGMLKVLYEELHRICYYYGIDSGNFVVRKGVILRQRGSFPLSRITDIYLARTYSDLLFNLCNLHISTPTRESSQFAHISGLSRKSAFELQNYLFSLLEAKESEFKVRPVQRLHPHPLKVEPDTFTPQYDRRVEHRAMANG